MKRFDHSLILEFLRSRLLLLLIGVLIAPIFILTVNAGELTNQPSGSPAALFLVSPDSQDKDDPKGLKSAAKAVVNKLVAEDYEGIRKNFNEEMKQGLTAERMREVWTSVIQQTGQYRSQSEPNLSHVPGYDVVIIRCQMERGAITVEVDFDPAGKIGGLWVRPAS